MEVKIRDIYSRPLPREKPNLNLIGRFICTTWWGNVGEIIGILSDDSIRVDFDMVKEWEDFFNESSEKPIQIIPFGAFSHFRLLSNDNLPKLIIKCLQCRTKENIYPSVYGYICDKCHDNKIRCQ